MKKSYTIFILFLMSVICGCSESEYTEDHSDSTIEFNTRAVPPELMNNMRLFLFDGDNRNNADGQYDKELLNIIRLDDKLSMNVESGKWNIALVGCEDDPLTQLVAPVRGSDPADLLMWKTQPVGGKLPDIPDIRTGLIESIDIIPSTLQNTSASLNRHVSMIRVCLEDGVGFKTGAGHMVYLKNVPTSLSWSGSLYPDKDNPAHSGDTPMNGSLTFIDAGSGHQKSSDNVNFIVPAHKSANDNDTTTHKLTLGVRFITMGGTLFEEEVKIDKVPRDNKIVQVNISAKGGVEVQTTIAPWNLEEQTVTPGLYEMSVEYNAVSGVWEYDLTMKQERNWWVTLSGTNPGAFEFVDSAAASGQLGTTVIKVKRSSQHSGTIQSATLNLHVSGYDNVVQSWPIQG